MGRVFMQRTGTDMKFEIEIELVAKRFFVSAGEGDIARGKLKVKLNWMEKERRAKSIDRRWKWKLRKKQPVNVDDFDERRRAITDTPHENFHRSKFHTDFTLRFESEQHFASLETLQQLSNLPFTLHSSKYYIPY